MFDKAKDLTQFSKETKPSKASFSLPVIIFGILFLAFIYWWFSQQKLLDNKTFRVENLQFDYESQEVICLASKTESSFIFQKIKNYPESVPFTKKENYLQKIKTCRNDFKTAIENDEILESALYKDKLDIFFANAKVLKNSSYPKQLLFEKDLLSQTLKAQINKLPPAQIESGITVFDIALMNKRAKDVIENMPSPETILPHQRYALFRLGAFSALDNTAATTDETIAKEKIDSYQTQMRLALQLGSSDIAANALSSLIANIGTSNHYDNYKGGFTDFDYFLANANCDTSYAKFLNDKKIKPQVSHILHLLSTIGYAQYPEMGSEFADKSFKYADNSLGLPVANNLNQCTSLAQFYADNTVNFNDDHPELENDGRANNAYNEVYKIAHDAIFQRWVRRDSEEYKTGRAPNTKVIGDPSLLINAAVAILQKQPASLEQYCAWARHAHAWTSLAKDGEKNVASAMLDMPKKWVNADKVYKRKYFACEFYFNITNEYQDTKGGLAYMNNELKNAKIPCQGKLAAAGHAELSCQVKTVEWPQKETPPEF